jgi:hypothetical protein
MRFTGRRTALSGSVRHLLHSFALLACLAPLHGATLERLTLDEMIAKSTAIVRGKVTGSWAGFSGPVIYTHYTIQVSEQLKGDPSGSVEVAIPGGEVKGLRQSFSGAPVLNQGEEYVLLLWTANGAPTQVIGLTQGLFSLPRNGGADPVATRAATRELMLDRESGRPVKDQTLTMPLSELRSRISTALGAAKRSKAQ